jgi:AcrR family transcriptional regulator
MAYPSKTNLPAVRDAATALIEREGEAALTLRRLASDLGLTANAVYRYFSSREVLLATVADGAARRLADAIGTALRDAGATDPIKRIRIMAGVYAAFSLDHPAIYRTLVVDRREAEATLPQPLGIDMLWALVVAELAEVTGPDAAPEYAVSLWGLLHGLFALRDGNLLRNGKPDGSGLFGVELMLDGLKMRFGDNPD